MPDDGTQSPKCEPMTLRECVERGLGGFPPGGQDFSGHDSDKIQREEDEKSLANNRHEATGGVIPGSSEPFACTCGVELPLNQKALDAGRLYTRYSVNRPFNRVFYQLLLGIGVGSAQIHDEIKLISVHRKHLQLSRIQVRIAYGIFRHVCSLKTGLLTKRKVEGVARDADGLALNCGDGESPAVAGFTKDDWPVLEAEALTVSVELPESASVAKEFTWIRSKLYQWPDFAKAPSQGAIGTWLAVMRPGNESLLRTFVTLDWNKRLSPGERVGKDRDPLRSQQDVGGDTQSAEHDTELEGRLFGNSGVVPDGL